MAPWTTGVLLLCISIYVTTGRKIVWMTEEQILMTDLFENYSSSARPVYNASDPVIVQVSFVLATLKSLSLKDQILSTNGFIKSMWKDERLEWEPDEYGGIQSIVVGPSMVWLPDVVLQNSVGPVLYKEEYFTLFNVEVSHDGLCKWVPGGDFQSQCSVNVRKFPFDTQQCTLTFGNWMYSGQKVHFQYSPCHEEELRGTYSEHGEWDLVDSGIVHTALTANCCSCSPDPFPTVHFSLTFRRKSLYYTMNLVGPSTILSVLVLMVLWLPPESGERMSMAVTLLLSFTIFLLMVSEHVPSTSDAVPIIVIYLVATMTITCLIIATSVLVLQVHHHNMTSPPPPWMLRCLCGVKNRPVVKEVFHYADSPELNNDQFSVENIRNTAEKNDHADIRHVLIADRDGMTRVLSKILKALESHDRAQQQSLVENEVAQQWKVVAAAFDRICFWIFLAAKVLSAVTILVVLPTLED